MDASADVGLGHFMRCLALAQQLQDQGKTPFFVTKTNLVYLLSLAKKEKIRIIPMNADSDLPEDAAFVNNMAEQKSASWVVLDGYNLLDRDYQETVVKKGRSLLCLDDLARGHFICHALINQNLGAESLPYSCEPYTKLFLGTKYLLVKREFRKLQTWERPIRKKAKNILITLGGGSSGSSALMPKIGQAICSLRDPSLHIKLIFGSDPKNDPALGEFLNQCPSQIEYYPFVPDMLALMKWADFVITAAGSTVWELLLTCAPMMIFTIAENQKIIERFLTPYHCAKVWEGAKEISSDEIAYNIKDLIESQNIRAHYSARCKILKENELDFFRPQLIFGEYHENLR